LRTTICLVHRRQNRYCVTVSVLTNALIFSETVLKKEKSFGAALSALVQRLA
jgi:hypothetical protein